MKKKLMGVMMVVLSVVGAVVFQQVARTAPRSLTALDYAEIHQLYARYAVAADTDIDDGEMFARVFTEDGVINGNSGYEQLKAVANDLDKFRAENGMGNTPSHYVSNILIEPTAEGAMGVAYNHSPEGGKGVYHDQLVKTPEGWRFKQRTFTGDRFSAELLQALAP